MSLSWNDFLPQGEEIKNLHRQLDEGKMVHALLISGETGVGKKSLASLIAKSLLCRSENEKPCCLCNSCLMAEKQEHPDLLVLERGKSLTGVPPRNKTSIPVSEIREMIRLSAAWTFEGGNRVIQINQAEDMNPQAQNCLLKILEEPPAGTYFILTSDHPDQLLTTVRSRCRPLKMKPWDDEVIVSVLKKNGTEQEKARIIARAARGSVGAALKLAADDEYWTGREEIIRVFFRTRSRSEILKISGQWKDRKGETDFLFDILEDAVRSLLEIRMNPEEKSGADDFPKEWTDFASGADYERFTFLFDRIAEARKQCSFNVNFQAVFEQQLLTFIGMI